MKQSKVFGVRLARIGSVAIVALVAIVGAVLGGCDSPAPRVPTVDPPDLVCPTVYSHAEEVEEVLARPLALSGTGDQYQTVITNNTNDAKTYEVRVESGTNPIWRLYFLTTNPTSEVVQLPKLSVLEVPADTKVGNSIRPTPVPDLAFATGASHSHSAHTPLTPPVEYFHPSYPAHLLQRTPALSRDVGDSNFAQGDAAEMACPPPAEDLTEVGDVIEDFYIGAPASDIRDTIKITARAVQDVNVEGGRTQRVIFWVTDNVYEGCADTGSSDCLPADGLLTASDVEEIAGNFIQSGPNNDIYDWQNQIFGPHWGDHTKCDMLISPAHQQIDVVMFNIGNYPVPYDGGVIGYYWAGNNFRKNVFSNSNERLVLHIHAPWFKLSDSSVSSEGEALEQSKTNLYYSVLSALAHEYQHLIHFYQRDVLSLSGNVDRDSTWINELFSLASQDLIGHNIRTTLTREHRLLTKATDDRGTSDLGAGAYGIGPGTLLQPFLERQTGRGLSQWHNQLWNYGISFSFASYLARNYGGAQVIVDAYRSERKNDAAISEALHAASPGLDMGKAVAQWGVAMLLSDKVNQEVGYRLNYGEGGLTSPYNGADYHLGSINYYNYARGGANGGSFRIFRDSKDILQHLCTHDGHANVIIAVAEDLEGTGRFKITLSPGHQLTAVAKRASTLGNPVFYDPSTIRR